MPVSLVALVAAAIYQAGSPLADDDELNRTLGLIGGALDGQGLSLEAGEADLLVNGAPVSLAAPGAVIVRQALLDHDTRRLVLPPGIAVAQWREIVEIYASAPGLYSSLDDLRDALRTTVPDAVVSGSAGPTAEGDLRDALFELPGLRATTPNVQPVRAANPDDAELAALTARLDPMLKSAADAREKQDYAALAQTLLQIRELEDAANDAFRAIVARERRRVIPAPVLESMARAIPKPGSSLAIGRVLRSMGKEGSAALINALTGAPGPHERRAYIDALVEGHDCDDAIIGELTHTGSPIMREAAEIAGRKRLERAVPALNHLLKHPNVEVRTASWHALELIGTPAALKALRS